MTEPDELPRDGDRRVAPPIPDDIRVFLDDTRFATISTIDPDGAAWPAVIWYTLDGDEIVMNSAVGRRWPANLVRDPRVAFSVVDNEDGYRWVALTGRVTVVEDQPTAQADIAAMCRRYHAHEPDEAERARPRAIRAASPDQLPPAPESHRPAFRLTDAARRRARRRGWRGEAGRRPPGRSSVRTWPSSSTPVTTSSGTGSTSGPITTRSPTPWPGSTTRNAAGAWPTRRGRSWTAWPRSATSPGSGSVTATSPRTCGALTGCARACGRRTSRSTSRHGSG